MTFICAECPVLRATMDLANSKGPWPESAVKQSNVRDEQQAALATAEGFIQRLTRLIEGEALAN